MHDSHLQDIRCAVPPMVGAETVMRLARPKSANLVCICPSRHSTKTFPGFRSPWTMGGLRLCR